jgi:hypothetical protein
MKKISDSVETVETNADETVKTETPPTIDFKKLLEQLEATQKALKDKEKENADLVSVNTELQNQVETNTLAAERKRPVINFDSKNYEVYAVSFKHEGKDYVTLDLTKDELGKEVLRAILQRPGQRLLVEITK